MTAILAGAQLIDGKTMKNVTEERIQKLTAIKVFRVALLSVRSSRCAATASVLWLHSRIRIAATASVWPRIWKSSTT